MIIAPRRIGQLGNQLFAIAHFAAAAIVHKVEVRYPCFEYSLENFPDINSHSLLRISCCLAFSKSRVCQSISVTTEDHCRNPGGILT